MSREGQRERQRERERIPTNLRNVSTESDAGPVSRTEIMT